MKKRNKLKNKCEGCGSFQPKEGLKLIDWITPGYNHLSKIYLILNKLPLLTDYLG